jgi:hypothetical protein
MPDSNAFVVLILLLTTRAKQDGVIKKDIEFYDIPNLVSKLEI